MALLKRGRGGISNQLQIATRGLPLVRRDSGPASAGAITRLVERSIPTRGEGLHC
jgi:hypothetical protein